ncbi:MAG: hypothetical protein GX472_00025, partial [Methanomicrobiales archaeon]|nr:hypothetical protein [Methanomicrobiales archaeon]
MSFLGITLENPIRGNRIKRAVGSRCEVCGGEEYLENLVVHTIIEEEEENKVDEEELTSAVNKSLLVNLFEGCLVDAVRKGASDIHIIPKEGNSTE